MEAKGKKTEKEGPVFKLVRITEHNTRLYRCNQLYEEGERYELQSDR